MNPNLSGYTFQKFAEGRFDVVLDNGLRAGTVTGGGGCWLAERRGTAVGYHPSKKKAAEAILEAGEIVPLFEQMRRIIDRPRPLLRNYWSDFEQTDRDLLIAFRSAVDFIWVVHPNGTHLQPLDVPSSKSRVGDIIAARQCAGTPFEVYHIDQASTKVRCIGVDQALALAGRQPAWRVQETSVLHYGSIVADVQAKVLPTADTWPGNKGAFVFHCRREPSPRTCAVLLHLGGDMEIHRAHSLFACPASIEIRFDGRRVDGWEAASLKAA